MVNRILARVIGLKPAQFNKGKTYWVLVGDREHEPSVNQAEYVQHRLAKDFPDMNWIVSPYYIKPVLKQIKKRKTKKTNKTPRTENEKVTL